MIHIFEIFYPALIILVMSFYIAFHLYIFLQLISNDIKKKLAFAFTLFLMIAPIFVIIESLWNLIFNKGLFTKSGFDSSNFLERVFLCLGIMAFAPFVYFIKPKQRANDIIEIVLNRRQSEQSQLQLNDQSHIVIYSQNAKPPKIYSTILEAIQHKLWQKSSMLKFH